MNNPQTIQFGETEVLNGRRPARRNGLLAPRWRKVFRDLWANKTRSFLVILSIAVGVMSVGIILGSQQTMVSALNESYAAINPSHITLMSLSPFDETLAKSVAEMPEVDVAEPRRGLYARVENKGNPGEWEQIQVISLVDFNDPKVDKISADSGQWPPEKHQIVIERTAIGIVGAEVGDTIIVKGPNGKERSLEVVGLAHDLLAKLFVIDGMAVGYVDADTYAWLGGQPGFIEMRVRVAGDVTDADAIRETANKVQDKIERSGTPVIFSFVPPPNQHPLNYVVQALSVTFAVLGILALFLSGFLVINIVSSLMSQQVRQIGLMKSFGAKTWQIMSMYMLMMVIIGVSTLLIAVPLSYWGMVSLTEIMGDYFNFDVVNLRMPPSILATEAAVALLVPLGASIFPIWRGTRVTVHEAMNDYGVASNYGQRRSDKALHQFGSRLKLSRPVQLALRNTFRRRKRLILTVGTLIFSGTVYMSVASVNDSLLSTIDDMLDYYGYDIAFQLKRSYRTEMLERIALQNEGVERAEAWAFYNTRLVREDGSHGGMTILFAPPGDTDLVNPTMESGRWLLPSDTRGVVVNNIFLRDEPNLGLGDRVTFKVEGKETTWEIVGIAKGGQVVGMAFVNYEAFSREIGNVDRADWLMVKTIPTDEAAQIGIRDEIQSRFDQRGMVVNASSTMQTERTEIEAIFQILIVMLFLMTFLLALVGSLGLAGTMSINVLERSREIGIMRAIGASDKTVLFIFMLEGIFIGVMSWVVAFGLAWPLSAWMSQIIGDQFLNTPLSYTFSQSSVWMWLLVVILLAAVSCFWPAWSASRLTVNQALSYE